MFVADLASLSIAQPLARSFVRSLSSLKLSDDKVIHTIEAADTETTTKQIENF